MNQIFEFAQSNASSYGPTLPNRVSGHKRKKGDETSASRTMAAASPRQDQGLGLRVEEYDSTPELSPARTPSRRRYATDDRPIPGETTITVAAAIFVGMNGNASPECTELVVAKRRLFSTPENDLTGPAVDPEKSTTEGAADESGQPPTTTLRVALHHDGQRHATPLHGGDPDEVSSLSALQPIEIVGGAGGVELDSVGRDCAAAIVPSTDAGGDGDCNADAAPILRLHGSPSLGSSAPHVIPSATESTAVLWDDLYDPIEGWTDSEDDEPALALGEDPVCCNCTQALTVTKVYACHDGRRRYFCKSCPSPARPSIKRHFRSTVLATDSAEKMGKTLDFRGRA
eukprot:m.108495 g.108495  ORF g.108495 m.108495 type:complete len:343 (-) comp21220_c0_seq1:110-1138(-)